MTEGPFFQNVVILTGASVGIGRELALQLADQGARLVLAARNLDKLKQVATDCNARGGQAVALQTDVSQQTACEALIEKTVETFGRVDTLINNAGISMWARFEEMQTLEPFKTIMDVNYMGSVYCTFYALPYLEQSQGRIVAVSSLAGKAGVPTRSGYGASKHAIVGFFDSLRVELAGSGVSVTIVYPDFVTSEIRKRAYGPDGQPLGKSPVQENEVMSAEECARIIINAAARRKREEVMSLRGRIGQWIKLIAPGVIDRIALRAIQRGR